MESNLQLNVTEGGVGVGVFRFGLNGTLGSFQFGSLVRSHLDIGHSHLGIGGFIWSLGFGFSIWVAGSFSLGHWSFPSDHWDLDFHWVTGLFSLGHLVVLTGSLDCFRFGFWSRAHGISVFNLTSVFKCCVRCNCVCLMVQRWACRLGEVHYIFGGFYPDILSGAGHLTSPAFNFLKISVLYFLQQAAAGSSFF